MFAAPDVIAKELRQRYALELVGRAKDIRQRFYAISVERKIKNPAVVAICEVSRSSVRAPEPSPVGSYLRGLYAPCDRSNRKLFRFDVSLNPTCVVTRPFDRPAIAPRSLGTERRIGLSPAFRT